MTKEEDLEQVARERTLDEVLGAEGASGGSLRGWHVTGPGDGRKDYRLIGYEGGIDSALMHDGQRCAFLRSNVAAPDKHAVVMQSIRSERYLGRRVRFGAWVKNMPGTMSAGLWMRVVPVDRDRSFAAGHFDASDEWQLGAVVLDVAPESASILFGLSLTGAGGVWMSGAEFTIVDASVSTTDRMVEPAEPRNLRFDE
jgi:hypothetical protein